MANAGLPTSTGLLLATYDSTPTSQAQGRRGADCPFDEFLAPDRDAAIACPPPTPSARPEGMSRHSFVPPASHEPARVRTEFPSLYGSPSPPSLHDVDQAAPSWALPNHWPSLRPTGNERLER